MEMGKTPEKELWAKQNQKLKEVRKTYATYIDSSQT